MCKYYKINNFLTLTFTFPTLVSRTAVLVSREFISVLRSFMFQKRIQYRYKRYCIVRSKAVFSFKFSGSIRHPTTLAETSQVMFYDSSNMLFLLSH